MRGLRLRRTTARARTALFFVLACLAFASAAPIAAAKTLTAAGPAAQPPSIARFRRELPRTVRADHPAILPVAAAIRTLSHDPLEQLVLVNDVTHLLVDYDDDERVYGRAEYHATLDEMLARRRDHGWLYLRDDCDGRAVFAAHLLAALGIPWRLEASGWKQHAWVVARVQGVDYDLLDLRPDAPELDRLSYRLIGRWVTRKSRRPPPFDWRQRWAAQADLAVGLRLGLVTLDSSPGHLRERHSTDWVKQSPAAPRSPLDERTLTAVCAGFPYGEPLHVTTLAAATPPAASPAKPGSSLTAHPATLDAVTAP
ncbi:MAG TPA: hypothetical protein VGD81_02940 [Opitutaceae bacterium]